jgi:ethanolamine permease
VLASDGTVAKIPLPGRIRAATFERAVQGKWKKQDCAVGLEVRLAFSLPGPWPATPIALAFSEPGSKQPMSQNPPSSPPRKLSTLDLWALGVGIVVCGQYFGWNLGLAGNGPVAMLIASLLVCLLFLAWVLTLAELSVAMPLADGPLEYGRRAWGPGLGFLMAWSMLLECQFGTVATALASGSYVAFLVNPAAPDPAVQLGASLATVVVFFFLQAWGVKEQARVQVLTTCAALAGLLLYWAVAGSDFRWERAWPESDWLAGKGWKAVLDAVPYALWWLIIIEGVALAAEETSQPQRSIPRGLVLAMLTVIGMVLLTLGLGCGALDWQELTGDYPLAKVVRHVLGERAPLLVYAFGFIALFGLIASYHGLFYSTSRQAFALGRAGYLPRVLGRLHANRQTPVPALLISSIVTVGFVLASLKYPQAINVTILVAGLASLIWYVLAMGCLLILRRREPGLFRQYRSPLQRVLPATVLLLSLFAIYFYLGIDVKVLPLTGLLYLVGLGCYLWWGRRQVATSPSGLAVVGEDRPGLSAGAAPSRPLRSGLAWLERITEAVLVAVLVFVGWIMVARQDPSPVEVLAFLGLVVAALALISVAVLLASQKPALHDKGKDKGAL